MRGLTPSKIVDKNGKQNTVHKRSDGASGDNRVPLVAPTSSSEHAGDSYREEALATESMDNLNAIIKAKASLWEDTVAGLADAFRAKPNGSRESVIGGPLVSHVAKSLAENAEAVVIEGLVDSWKRDGLSNVEIVSNVKGHLLHQLTSPDQNPNAATSSPEYDRYTREFQSRVLRRVSSQN